MKRYRLLSFDIDSRPSLLKMEIKESWDEKVKVLHLKQKQEILQDLDQDFGSKNKDYKISNFIELGDKSVSIIAYHNRFLEQIRVAFVMGAYYPALVAACTLGERILNHMIKVLKEDFRASPYYKKVYSKDSFDDWEGTISVLEAWDVLLPSVAATFRALNKDRNKAVHFNPSVDTNDHSLALEAILKLQSVIGEQFSAFGPQPWFIPDVRGEIYIKKEYETRSFTQKIYLPNCIFVGPYHVVESYREGKLFVRDDYDYEEKEISDDEFVRLRKNLKQLST
jgi:hypothetical protein